jgi:excisionase family DNA binding protein
MVRSCLAFLVVTAHTHDVTTTLADDVLLTTGQAAATLGCSRQHVVDLCDRGALPFVSVGTHRRVRRTDVEAISSGDGVALRMTRDQVRSLWLHRAVAGRLAGDPDGVLARARGTIDRWLIGWPEDGAARSLREWRELIDAGPEVVMAMLVSPAANARELRQTSPFTRVLTEAERQSIVRAFHASWKRGVAR